MRSALIAAAVALAVAGGVRGGAGRGTGEDTLAVPFSAPPVDQPVATFIAPDPGSALGLTWTQGATGPGPGGQTATVSLLRSGVALCSVVVPCDAPAGASTSAECSAALAAGDALSFAVTGSDCPVTPSGVLASVMFWQ